MPRSRSESIPHKEHSDEDGNRERDKCCNRGNREEGSNRYRSAENEQGHDHSNDGVVPHGVDRSLSTSVHTLDNMGQREAVVTGIRISHS